MAVLNKADFFSRMNEMVGTDTSDTAIAFIEDMTDTYNDMEKRANGDGENWEQRYHDLDEAWKKKYRSRFFSSGGNSRTPEDADPDDTKNDPNKTKIEDLFTPVDKK